jgi:hypothetical protein
LLDRRFDAPALLTTEFPAVIRADLLTAEVLLSYRANTTRPEPSTGLSGVTAAFKQLNAPMAELLLKYGADPDAPDGNGRTGRSLMKKNGKLQELLQKWDENGALAFEVCVQVLDTVISSLSL